MSTQVNGRYPKKNIFEIIRLKTAELLSVSCEAGAVVADADKKMAEDLKKFGLNMGIAFQIVDDILDYSSSEEEFGKPVGKDFREGKITLPLIYTISGMKKSDVKRFKALLVNGSNKVEDYDETYQCCKRKREHRKDKDPGGRICRNGCKMPERLSCIFLQG